MQQKLQTDLVVHHDEDDDDGLVSWSVASKLTAETGIL